MVITESDLRQIHKRLKPLHGGLWQDCFAVAYLMKEFKISEEEAAEYSSFGANDYGFDAFYLSETRRNLYLYQFKFTTDHKQFADSLVRMTEAGMERVFGNPLQDQNQNRLLDALRSSLYEKKDVVERVFIHCVFTGDPAKAESNKHLESLREDLEARRHFLATYFKRPVDLAFEFIKDHKSDGIKKPPPPHFEFPFDFGDHVHRVSTDAGHTLILGTVPLVQLVGFLTAMGPKLFARNIRFGIGSDTAPNRAIKKALGDILLRGSDPPEAFTFFHNGITLTAEALREGPPATIVEPRVLNGAQTITTARAFLDSEVKNPQLAKAQDSLAKIRVITRLVMSPPGKADFITKVTINNNKQNPVEPSNLRANDAIQLQFDDAFHDQLKIFYERQVGAFKAMQDSDLEELGFQPGRAIELTRFAKTILASQGKLKLMSYIQDVFEQDAKYNDVFRSAYLDTDARRWVIAYKVQRILNLMTSAIHEQGERKYWYIFSARNLIWALGIQGFLNGGEDTIESMCVEYGCDLKLPTGLRAYFGDLASKRLRFIIGAVAEKYHAEELELNKTTFLSTDAMFDDCMAYAKTHYKWVKRSM
jgi:hypothetical protein